ncbi:penicillin-binding transpeptidase domain-containing protein [Fodinicola acaciae]|uniref:penicillin-binding transpeptidase domain-containing protein n=1 Tax=Fodinicola acaciae TaxID=2681555 RepID=UPI0013D481FF|nr:penicillin-binding transpeptidase domain-containing protein [Fodinicola acaciae]
MNAPLRRVAVAVMVLFTLLFLNLNWVQVVKGGEYRNNPLNRRTQIQDFDRKRGQILNGDRQIIADTQATTGQLKYLRKYPAGNLYSAVTGYFPVTGDPYGLEAYQNQFLTGDSDKLFVRRLSDLVTGRQAQGGTVQTTVRQKVQQAAYNALGNQKGAIVALDPTSGAILGMVSGPSYDPNQLATHNYDAYVAAYNKLIKDPNNPIRNKATNETYPPGSTFKVVDSAVALANGYNPQSSIPSGTTYTAPGTTTPIKNDHGSSCAGDGKTTTLLDALRVSCNTAYAQLAVALGTDKIRNQANQFGFGADISNDSVHAATSKLGDIPDKPSLAQSAIGQRDVRMSPLQGAMIAGAVANGGIEMKPYLVSDVLGPDLSSLGKTSPEQYGQPITPQIAGSLQQMMQSVVGPHGTGKDAAISDVTVGGKTGTAQNGDGGEDTTWFIGYAIDKGKPVAAVAVVLDHAGGSSSIPSGMAGKVLQAAVEVAKQQ